MVVERWLVGDDQVLAAGDGLFEHGVGVHEGGYDASDYAVGVARFQRIDGACRRSCSGRLDDPLHDFGRGEMSG